jgi:hypothetical protein
MSELIHEVPSESELKAYFEEHLAHSGGSVRRHEREIIQVFPTGGRASVCGVERIGRSVVRAAGC